MKQIWMVLLLTASLLKAEETVVLDGNLKGSVFEGIGALSAGASSRLLIDYPEPQRSQILDFLFKPKFGASLQHFKVEIGGDIQSTDGTEPSHMRSRTDLDFTRGYEWWLMKEAKVRNPKIYLDCLEWGAPGWIGNGNYWSQDNADYVVKFIQGAKSVHGLDIDYTGLRNERGYDAAYAKLFKKTLTAAGIKAKVVGEDLYWGIVPEMVKDSQLRDSLDIIGGHYSMPPAAAKTMNKPLWSSEDGPWNGDWNPGALAIASKLNRNYVTGGMTKTVIWALITSFYDNLPLHGAGLMTANTPWSGYYNVQPALWAVAHTTQFTEPGWSYLSGSGCGLLKAGGSYVTLKDPKSGNYTVVIETKGASASQMLRFSLGGGLDTGSVNVVESTSNESFKTLDPLTPVNGSFSFSVAANAIYTLSTTSNFSKGSYPVSAATSFPFPYHETFDGYGLGKTPKYFSDQAGAFETVTRENNQIGLAQVMVDKGITWYPKDREPVTIVGDSAWKDYDVEATIELPERGYTAIYGRVGTFDLKPVPFPSYWVKCYADGSWEIGKLGTVLTKGKFIAAAKSTHTLRLCFKGSAIRAELDGRTLGSVADTSYSQGMAGLGSGLNKSVFDNFKVIPGK